MDAVPKLQREQIATLLTEALFLLDAAAQGPMKDQVLSATSDLDEGLMWLQQPGVETVPRFCTPSICAFGSFLRRSNSTGLI